MSAKLCYTDHLPKSWGVNRDWLIDKVYLPSNYNAFGLIPSTTKGMGWCDIKIFRHKSVFLLLFLLAYVLEEITKSRDMHIP